MQVTAQEVDVRNKLLTVTLAIEIASLVLLGFFLHQKVVSDRTGIVLLALLPIVFGLHVTEEFVYPGGYISWVRVYRRRFADTPGSFYVKINAIPGIGMVLLLLGSFDYRGGYGRTALHT